jgi:Flp pilus assembly protein TadG
MSLFQVFVRTRRNARRRRATATVELAICFPVMFLLTIGTIDVCSMLFLKETVTMAAYEGARRGMGRDRTNTDATNRVTEFLDERNVNYEAANVVSFSNPDFDSADTLDNVTVTVTVPCSGNLIIPSAMFDDLTMTASVTMRKEYKNQTP